MKPAVRFALEFAVEICELLEPLVIRFTVLVLIIYHAWAFVASLLGGSIP